jgi:hypothetical protein
MLPREPCGPEPDALPKGSGASAPTLPWEAELARQELAEVHARAAVAQENAKAQELARRMALIETAEMETAA